MSAGLPDRFDPWRMITARRCFEGKLPIARMTRLLDSLLSSEGAVAVTVGFDKDSLGTPFVALQIEAQLSLQCQRTLQAFEFPVHIDTRLGLIRSEADEAALPEGYEPLLVGDEDLDLKDLVEDELILALPVVPLSPRHGDEPVWQDPEPEPEPEAPNPFAALQALKKDRN